MKSLPNNAHKAGALNTIAALYVCFTADVSAAAGSVTVIPPLMLPNAGAWSGGTGGPTPAPEAFLPADYLNSAERREAALARGVRVDRVPRYLALRTLGEFIPPVAGIGPISDDPAHPFFSDALRSIGLKSSFRVADANNDAAKNLLPWAFEALAKQRALALEGQNAQTRFTRCWELGVPGFDEAQSPLYFIQTAEQVVMFLSHRVRHIYMNVPHAKNLLPSWYGESVGRYEGDTLVVDTIGQNDKTFVDGYRTPHTAQIHVVERFRVTHDGSALDTTFTVEDPGAFHQPWSARRPRFRIDNHPFSDGDRICSSGGVDEMFSDSQDRLPHADMPDF